MLRMFSITLLGAIEIVAMPTMANATPSTGQRAKQMRAERSHAAYADKKDADCATTAKIGRVDPSPRPGAKIGMCDPSKHENEAATRWKRSRGSGKTPARDAQ